MPNAAQFRAAAQAVEAQLGAVSSSGTTFARLVSNTGMVGAGAPKQVSDDLDEAGRLAGLAATAIEELAAEMHRRADECDIFSRLMDQFRDQWDRYVRDVEAGLPSTAPNKPVPSAPWISL